MQPELHNELEKGYESISRMLGLGRDLLTFEYTDEDGKTLLHLITRNPRHNQSFLFHTTQGFGPLDALQKMMEYIKENRNTKNTYTIQWALSDSSELHTSYFRGKNLYELLDKFYYGKAITDTIIFNISLNPIS